MKSHRNSLLSIAVAVVLGLSVWAQQSSTTNQQQNQGMQGMQSMPGMQGGQMQHGQMHGKGTNKMMQNCHKNMQSMQQTNEDARQEIATAKQSNDPTKIRAALDEADKALAGVSDHMQKCQGMMQDMQGMSGMMSGQQK